MLVQCSDQLTAKVAAVAPEPSTFVRIIVFREQRRCIQSVRLPYRSLDKLAHFSLKLWRRFAGVYKASVYDLGVILSPTLTLTSPVPLTHTFARECFKEHKLACERVTD